MEGLAAPTQRESLRSRRRFLQCAAAPLIVPASVLGRGGAVAPSERITVGCIGLGNRGGQVLRDFLYQDVARVVAVCDVERRLVDATRRTVDDHYGARGCAGHADFRELLARRDIDAVLIATPDHWHVLMAVAAARAGKDVYLEKPLGLSLVEDLALRDAVRRYETVFQFGTQQRSDAKFRRACELVRNGRIGRLRTINVWSPTSRSGGSLKVCSPPPTLDYDMWLGPAPYVPHTEHRCANRLFPGDPQKIWSFLSDYCLGWIAGWGVHPLDIALWGGGPELGDPVNIRGSAVFPTAGACDTAVDWDQTITFTSGVTMRFTGQPAPPAWRKRYGRTGAHGTVFEGDEGWVHVARGQLSAHPKSLPDPAAEPGPIRLYESISHVRNFLDCIRTRSRPISSIDEAVRVDTLCHLCAIAARLGRPLRWDASRLRFIDDAMADRMLTRSMRSPWRL